MAYCFIKQWVHLTGKTFTTRLELKIKKDKSLFYIIETDPNIRLHQAIPAYSLKWLPYL